MNNTGCARELELSVCSPADGPWSVNVSAEESDPLTICLNWSEVSSMSGREELLVSKLERMM